MLSLLRRQIAHKLPCNARCFSAAEVSGITASSTPTAPASAQSRPSLSSVRDKKREYFVPRNTRGNLPVYTDVRNAGSRHLVLIRNIEGNATVRAALRFITVYSTVLTLLSGTCEGFEQVAFRAGYS